MKYQIRNGAKTVTTAGTRVALSTTDLWVRGFRIQANPANTGLIYLGDSSVAAANGYKMAASAVATPSDLGAAALLREEDLPVVNLKNIYVDSAVNGEGVSFTYLEVQY